MEGMKYKKEALKSIEQEIHPKLLNLLFYNDKTQNSI